MTTGAMTASGGWVGCSQLLPREGHPNIWSGGLLAAGGYWKKVVVQPVVALA
jgi:hypothetical protein